MNLFNIANLQTPRNIFTVREERVKREGSPYYTWTPGAIGAGASISINVADQFPDSRKYQPLDWIEVVNNEAADDLLLTINGDTTFPVPAGTIRTISNKALWHLTLTNQGGVATTLNKIIVTLQKPPLTIDKWARIQK